MSRRPALLAIACVLAVAGLAGCGLGSGGSGTGESLTLRVTENFGSERVKRVTEGAPKQGDTVLKLLQRQADIKTRYGGNFIEEIDGRAGGRQNGRPIDWFYYVNGIEAGVGLAEFKLSPGDRVWWDLHDWGAAMRIPAVVGSFPEPFVSGYRGRRIPVRIECADPKARECDEVAERLQRAGVQATSRSALGQRQAGGILRVLVGPWKRLRLDPVALKVERGPQQTGIYARFDPTGRELSLLDTRGRVSRTLGPGAGLVAATREGDEGAVWFVTGTDAAGLASAAAALDEDVLRQHFAVALENGQAVPTPITAPPGTGG